MLNMKNARASNARKIGPMTEAIAEELRAELARQKRSAKNLSESEGLNRSTLHKTLNAQRAIDVDDVFHLADLLGVSPSELFRKAEIKARTVIDDGLLPGEEQGIPDDYLEQEANVVRLVHPQENISDDAQAVASEYSDDRGEDGEGYDA